jgi:hypothetical protein
MNVYSDDVPVLPLVSVSLTVNARTIGSNQRVEIAAAGRNERVRLVVIEVDERNDHLPIGPDDIGLNRTVVKLCNRLLAGIVDVNDYGIGWKKAHGITCRQRMRLKRPLFCSPILGL